MAWSAAALAVVVSLAPARAPAASGPCRAPFACVAPHAKIAEGRRCAVARLAIIRGKSWFNPLGRLLEELLERTLTWIDGHAGTSLLASIRSCSGALIGDRLVLTAKHCVHGLSNIHYQESNVATAAADVIWREYAGTSPRPSSPPAFLDWAVLVLSESAKRDCSSSCADGCAIAIGGGAIEQGDPLLVIGHPYGSDVQASRGEVRAIKKGQLVHNAPTRVASSGSPVIDPAGRLIGVHAQRQTDRYGPSLGQLCRSSTIIRCLMAGGKPVMPKKKGSGALACSHPMPMTTCAGLDP